ncbi:hypothetical protein LINGRAHAP2_LOCUS20860, partial [Linum grandiflorum]
REELASVEFLINSSLPDTNSKDNLWNPPKKLRNPPESKNPKVYCSMKDKLHSYSRGCLYILIV